MGSPIVWLLIARLIEHGDELLQFTGPEHQLLNAGCIAEHVKVRCPAFFPKSPEDIEEIGAVYSLKKLYKSEVPSRDDVYIVRHKAKKGMIASVDG